MYSLTYHLKEIVNTIRNGITPALAGVNGQDITLSLRSQAGNRVSTSVNESHRIFGGLEGEAYGWDINTGITYAKSKASDALDSGYLNYGKTSEALLAGNLTLLVHNNLKMLVYGDFRRNW